MKLIRRPIALSLAAMGSLLWQWEGKNGKRIGVLLFHKIPRNTPRMSMRCLRAPHSCRPAPAAVHDVGERARYSKLYRLLATPFVVGRRGFSVYTLDWAALHFPWCEERQGERAQERAKNSQRYLMRSVTLVIRLANGFSFLYRCVHPSCAGNDDAGTVCRYRVVMECPCG